MQRANGDFGGGSPFGEFDIGYSGIPGVTTFRDFIQINGLNYVGTTGVKELAVFGDGGSSTPLAPTDPAQTSHYVLYNGVEIPGIAPTWYDGILG